VVTMPLPIEYGPAPDEEERVPVRSDDPSAPTVQVPAQVPDGEFPLPPPSYPTEDSRRGGEPGGGAGTASEAKAQAPAPPYLHQHPHTPTTNTVTSTANSTLTAKGPHVAGQPGPEGGHINLAFAQGHAPEKEGHNGKSSSLWNPTYGSWFLQQRKQQLQQQQRQGGVGGAGGAGGRVPGEGQEHVGRTVAEVAGVLGFQHQHKQFQQQLQQQQHHQLHLLHHQQQQQQQQGLCRPLLPPPPPPAVQSPLLLDSAALHPAPLYRLRRFPCGNIGYGCPEQGAPPEAAHGNPHPTAPPQQGVAVPSSAAHQRGVSIPASVSLGRSGVSEDNRPLLVTMGTVQDPRLPRMEGHNATVL